jgi:hypothetical protein
MLHELDLAKVFLEQGESARAQFTLKRVLSIMQVLVSQVNVLVTMSYRQFFAFRHLLGNASGFQSAQFRELEFLLGGKKPEVIRAFVEGSPARSRQEGLADAFVTGGGYKYCQLGEGNCFLRVPQDCRMRPVVTGWFSQFGSLENAEKTQVVEYGRGPSRFAGSTYDPTSHYRAAEVFDFFSEMGLNPVQLREVSQHQIRLLATGFDDLDLDPGIVTRNRSTPLEGIGGFLALHSPRAGEICSQLYGTGIHADLRGDLLRLGPAPYLSDNQLADAIGQLGQICKKLK